MKDDLKQRVTETVYKFMEGWLYLNRRQMWRYSQKTWRANHKKGELTKRNIEKWELQKIERGGSAAFRVKVKVWWFYNGENIKTLQNKVLWINVVGEKKPYKPSLEGKFGVNPDSIERSWRKSTKAT